MYFAATSAHLNQAIFKPPPRVANKPVVVREGGFVVYKIKLNAWFLILYRYKI